MNRSPMFLRYHDFFKYLLRFIVLRIQAGPLKGKKWIAATSIRYIKGRYEPFNTKALIEHIREGDVIYDVGAHVGYYSAIASLLVGQKGSVIAFEPRPINIAFFKKHMRINDLGNVELVEAGVSDKTGEGSFQANTGTGTGHLSENGNITVKVVTLDGLYRTGKCPKPDLIKIDVEGGEMAVLEGAREMIEESKPTLLVATHGDTEYEFVVRFLEETGYEYDMLNERPVIGNKDILAVPGKPETQ